MLALIRANCGFLLQGLELLRKHDSNSYTNLDPQTYGSSIGAHMRHVLDHYHSLLAGVESGVVDYDNRPRDQTIERDPIAAIALIESVIEGLEALSGREDARLNVKVSSSVKDEESHASSSIGRELQFLVSHTVHHYALIAIASRMQGIVPMETFGVAPSTLKYLQSVGH